MNIVVPSTGPVPDQRTAGYVVNIASKLNASLIVLRILADNETEATGKYSLEQFVQIGKREKVPVKIILRRG